MSKKQIVGWSLIGLFVAIVFFIIWFVGGINALLIALGIAVTLSIFGVGAGLVIMN